MNAKKVYHSDVIYLVPELNSTGSSSISVNGLMKYILAKPIFELLKMLILAVLIIGLFAGTMTALIVLKDERLEQVKNLIDSKNDTTDPIGTTVSIVFGILGLQDNTTLTEVCKDIESIYFNFSFISHPIVVCIWIVCFVLVNLNSYNKKKQKVPIILPSFRKENRLYTAFVYGIIATNILKLFVNSAKELFASAENAVGNAALIKDVEDPSGLFPLVVQIVDIFITSLRHLPLLIAFYSDSFIIYALSAFYSLVDFGVYLFRESEY